MPKIWAFASEKDFLRCGEAIRRVERFYKFPPARKGPGSTAPFMGVVSVQCPTAGLAAGTPASPTSGTGAYYVPDGSGGPGEVLGDSVTLYNDLAVAVPSGGKTGKAAWRGGFLYLLSWDGC